MRDAMYTRGPDGSGDYREKQLVMAMRRLSVIDPEGGRQPMLTADGQVVAFQNGEIYNHKNLQKELQCSGFVFRSHSDTEVLAHGYQCWGIEGLLRRLNGMFAIAILDHKANKLHIARDRFGEKPLFYCAARGRFAYSSVLDVLAALPWQGDQLDRLSLRRYLAVHYAPGDRTILAGINRVLPGERLEVDVETAEFSRHRFYEVPTDEADPITDEELAELVEEAVVSRLEADVPLGVFLSGGLDSSIVAALAAKHVPGIATFSMGFRDREHDESPHALEMASAIGSSHHHFFFEDQMFGELLREVAVQLDEPIGDQALLPLYWLCREARKVVTVALSGEGADEIFGGYAYYWDRRLNSSDAIISEHANRSSSLFSSPSLVTPSGFPLLTDPATRQELIPGSVEEDDEWERSVVCSLQRVGDHLRRARLADLSTWLPDNLLVKYDRVAMMHSLEGRAPFLEPCLVEAGLTRVRVDSGAAEQESKAVLRRVAKRWLPKTLVRRRKQGFVLPMSGWLNAWFEAEGGVEAYFNSRRIEGIDVQSMIELVSTGLREGGRERLVFAIVMLAEWGISFRSRVSALRHSYGFYGYK